MKKIVVAILLACLPLAAAARDGWQGRPRVCDMADGPRLQKCQSWINTVRRPDYRTASCCGEGDAFVTDNFETGPNGEVWAIITGDYPENYAVQDAEGNDVPIPSPVHKGTRILIPPEKINHDQDDAGNTSGHGVVFLLPGGLNVLCFSFPPLT